VVTGVPETCSEIFCEIEVINEIVGFTIINGKVILDGKVIASCEMRILSR
jgi:hypothetical protein